MTTTHQSFTIDTLFFKGMSDKEIDKKLQQMRDLDTSKSQPLANVSDDDQKWLDNDGIVTSDEWEWPSGFKQQVYKLIFVLFMLLVPVNAAMHLGYNPFYRSQIRAQASNDAGTVARAQFIINHAKPVNVTILLWLVGAGLYGFWIWPYIVQARVLNQKFD